jgi:predicted peptidase
MQFIEFTNKSYKLDEVSGKKINIPHRDVLTYLHSKKQANSIREQLVQDSFDALFYYLERIENYLKCEFTTFEDIRSPLDYYVILLSKNKVVFEQYLKEIKHQNALDLLERFPEWKH